MVVVGGEGEGVEVECLGVGWDGGEGVVGGGGGRGGGVVCGVGGVCGDGASGEMDTLG